MNYKEAINNSKLRADPISCLEDLQTALDMVLNGYVIERVSPKGQLIEVIEKHPEVVPKIIKAKLDVLEVLRKQEDENVECKLVIIGGMDMNPPAEMKQYPV